jgi:Ca2+-binding EF-hand superfamily protein
VLVNFNAKLNSQRISVFDAVAPYDKLRVGTVSLNNFLRAFGSSPSVQAIAQIYSDSAGNVDYRRLHADIQLATSQQNRTLSGQLPTFFPEFVRALKARCPTYKDVFLAADRLRRGTLPPDSFYSVLASFRLGLSPLQLKQIAAPFMRSDLVDYELFLETAEGASVVTEQVYRPKEEPDGEGIIERFRDFAVRRRLQLRLQFDEVLRRRRPVLPNQQFYRLLGRLGFELLPAEMAALDEIFVRDGEFDVPGFLDRVEPMEAVPESKSNVLEMLKAHINERNVSLAKALIPFDREKSGIISIGQFGSVLRAIGFEVSPVEMRVLAERFGDGRTIKWTELAQELDPSPTSVTDSERPPELIDFLRRIYLAVSQLGVPLRTEFARQDIRRCGLLNFRIFKGVLESNSILSKSLDIAPLLTRYYQTGTDLIWYKRFCDDLEEFGPVTSASSPNSRPLRIFKALLSKQNLGLDDVWVRRDCHRTGTISLEDFRDTIKPILPSLGETLLCQIECQFLDRRHCEKFYYRRFLSALGDVVPTAEDLEELAVTEQQTPHPATPTDLLLQAIRDRLKTRRQTVYDLFRDVRDDAIPITQFRNRIEIIGIILTANDALLLFNRYKASRNSVSWQAFCADIQPELGT